MPSPTSTSASPVVAGMICGVIAVFVAVRLMVPGSATSGVVLQNTAAQASAQADLQALQGQWRIVPPFQALGYTFDTPVFGLTFAGDKMTFCLQPSFEHDCRVELDTASTPKRITLHGPVPGQVKMGLYELSPDGKTLTIALGRGDLRPEKLTPHQRELPYHGSLTFWFITCVREEPDIKSNPNVPHRLLWFKWLSSFHPPGRKLLQQFEEQAGKQQHDAALVALDQLIKKWEDDAELVLLRARLQLYGRKDYAAALQDFEKASNMPGYGNVHAALAWFLAACPDAQHRNGTRALEVANKACAMTGDQDADCLSARAAAYAELGNFADAVTWQKKALALPTGFTEAEKEAARARLQRYEQGKAYRLE